MAYEEIDTDAGLYIVDYDLVDRIIQNSTYFQYINTTAVRKEESEGFGLPTTYHLDVDFNMASAVAKSAPIRMRFADKFRRQVQNVFSQSCVESSGNQIEDLREELFDIEKSGREAKESFFRKQRETSRDSMKNIQSTAGQWETAIEVARFTRDASAEILLVSSTVMTGGAAGAAIAIGAGGSLLKGAAKWQDTGNLGAGLVQAGTSFITVIIPAGKGMPVGQQRVLFFVKAKTEFVGGVAVGVVEGKGLGEAALNSGIDVTLGKAFDGLKGQVLTDEVMKDLIKKGLKNKAIPVSLAMLNNSLSFSKGKMTSALTKSLMQKAKQVRSQQGLKNVAVTAPVLVDCAILGPDRTMQPRHW